LPVAIAAMISIVLFVWLCQLVYRLFKKFELDECMFESAAMIVAIVALVYADIFELTDGEHYDD
jgi:Kef-type K+ transport system membrane component KefB